MTFCGLADRDVVVDCDCARAIGNVQESNAANASALTGVHARIAVAGEVEGKVRICGHFSTIEPACHS